MKPTDETLREWAKQWAMSSEIPDLPKEVWLMVVEPTIIAIALRPDQSHTLSTVIDLQEFCFEEGETLSRFCSVGYSHERRVLVVSKPVWREVKKRAIVHA